MHAAFLKQVLMLDLDQARIPIDLVDERRALRCLLLSPLTLHILSSEDLWHRGYWLEGRHSNTQSLAGIIVTHENSRNPREGRE